jgi:hypothetical protein
MSSVADFFCGNIGNWGQGYHVDYDEYGIEGVYDYDPEEDLNWTLSKNLKKLSSIFQVLVTDELASESHDIENGGHKERLEKLRENIEKLNGHIADRNQFSKNFVPHAIASWVIEKYYGEEHGLQVDLVSTKSLDDRLRVIKSAENEVTLRLLELVEEVALRAREVEQQEDSDYLTYLEGEIPDILRVDKLGALPEEMKSRLVGWSVSFREKQLAKKLTEEDEKEVEGYLSEYIDAEEEKVYRKVKEDRLEELDLNEIVHEVFDILFSENEGLSDKELVKGVLREGLDSLMKDRELNKRFFLFNPNRILVKDALFLSLKEGL